MSVQLVRDRNTPIGDILRAAGGTVLLEAGPHSRYAAVRHNEDLIDFLLDRSPGFRSDCQRIREEMHAGAVMSHEDVRRLAEDNTLE